MKQLLHIVFVLLLSMQIQAQQKSISGTVTSATDGLPLPGVNVLVKGTTTGTQTNFDGKYTIIANVGDILEFSFIGMIKQSITIGSNSEINVTLIQDSAVLEEVVVVGYSNRKTRKMAVSSVSNVRSESKSKKQTAKCYSNVARNCKWCASCSEKKQTRRGNLY
jgi:Ca-activated chloride channel family protein